MPPVNVSAPIAIRPGGLTPYGASRSGETSSTGCPGRDYFNVGDTMSTEHDQGGHVVTAQDIKDAFLAAVTLAKREADERGQS